MLCSNSLWPLVFTFAALMTACSGDPSVSSIAAPTSIDDPNVQNRASTSCELALRTVRISGDLDCRAEGSCDLIVEFDVKAGLTENTEFEAGVGYSEDGTWYAVVAQEVTLSDDYYRFSARLPVSARTLELIPFVSYREDSVLTRLWDHNLLSGNYQVDSAENYYLQSPQEVCPEIPTIHFSSNWDEALNGVLVAGQEFKIDYALDRLPKCRGQRYGYPAWATIAFVQFDAVTPRTLQVTRINHSTREKEAFAPSIFIPPNARSVSIWFLNSNLWGCHAYDSDFSKNYQYQIQP